jgi:hypothetical protein
MNTFNMGIGLQALLRRLIRTAGDQPLTTVCAIFTQAGYPTQSLEADRANLVVGDAPADRIMFWNARYDVLERTFALPEWLDREFAAGAWVSIISENLNFWASWVICSSDAIT